MAKRILVPLGDQTDPVLPLVASLARSGSVTVRLLRVMDVPTGVETGSRSGALSIERAHFIGNSMGAQVAHPDALVVDIDGDGSFLMNIQELACAYVERIPVKVLLLNNQHLGMVVQWEDRFHGGNRGHTYLGAGMDADPYPDFDTIARGFGVRSRSVIAKADLDAAFEEMIECKCPFVLNVHVPYQEHVLPMIPLDPGKQSELTAVVEITMDEQIRSQHGRGHDEQHRERDLRPHHLRRARGHVQGIV